MHVAGFNDRSYYRERFEKETQLAAEATEPEVRRSHEEMAAHYAKMLEDPLLDDVAPVPEHLVALLPRTVI